MIEEPARLKTFDIEDLVHAFGKVIDEDDEPLQDKLLRLTITLARMGGISLAMRLGQQTFEEMRSKIL